MWERTLQVLLLITCITVSLAAVASLVVSVFTLVGK